MVFAVSNIPVNNTCNMNLKKIAIVAGGKELPILVAEEIQDKYELIVIGFKGLTHFKDFKKINAKVYELGILNPVKVFKILGDENITEALLIGKFFKNPILTGDLKINMLKKITGLGDTDIFELISREFARRKIKIFKQTDFLRKYVISEGEIIGKKIEQKDINDLRFGYSIARKIADLDIGQTAIVHNGVVVAIEALEGTDEAINRAQSLNIKGFKVIKAAKRKLDKRFDVPVAGEDTVRNIIKCGGNFLGLEAGKTILLNRDKIDKLCRKHKFSIMGVSKNI